MTVNLYFYHLDTDFLFRKSKELPRKLTLINRIFRNLDHSMIGLLVHINLWKISLSYIDLIEMYHCHRHRHLIMIWKYFKYRWSLSYDKRLIVSYRRFFRKSIGFSIIMKKNLLIESNKIESVVLDSISNFIILYFSWFHHKLVLFESKYLKKIFYWTWYWDLE